MKHFDLAALHCLGFHSLHCSGQFLLQEMAGQRLESRPCLKCAPRSVGWVKVESWEGRYSGNHQVGEWEGLAGGYLGC